MLEEQGISPEIIKLNRITPLDPGQYGNRALAGHSRGDGDGPPFLNANVKKAFGKLLGKFLQPRTGAGGDPLP